nr:MAG TPA: hypothetical protein [Caudoviricetes sp.]
MPFNIQICGCLNSIFWERIQFNTISHLVHLLSAES